LIEGFKREPIPKIELYRPSLGHPLIYPGDSHVIAIASDTPLLPLRQLPVLDLNRPEAILRFILDWLATQGRLSATG
jgi:molybdopterin-guanine dinucleotide biosynthesis protein B